MLFSLTQYVCGISTMHQLGFSHLVSIGLKRLWIMENGSAAYNFIYSKNHKQINIIRDVFQITVFKK